MEVDVMVDLHVGWGTNGLGMHAPLGGGLGYFLVMVATSFNPSTVGLDTSLTFFKYFKESSKGIGSRCNG